MKKTPIIFALVLPLLILSCAKEELKAPTDEALESRSPACTAQRIDYNNGGVIPFPITFFLPCVDEPILIPEFGLAFESEGRIVVSASCRVNDKGESALSFSGTGEVSGDSYTFVSETSFHDHYSQWDAETQTAVVLRSVETSILTNETTGEVLENAKLQFRFTINANGDLVNASFDPWECD